MSPFLSWLPAQLSEADEDEELLEDDDLGGSPITRFSENTQL